MKKWLLASLLFTFSGSLLACTQLPATTAFIVFNDKDGDLMLNQQEWQHAHLDKTMKTTFKMNDLDDFFRLDYDENWLVEAREIGFNNVIYLEQPCRKHKANRPLRKSKTQRKK